MNVGDLLDAAAHGHDARHACRMYRLLPGLLPVGEVPAAGVLTAVLYCINT